MMITPTLFSQHKATLPCTDCAGAQPSLVVSGYVKPACSVFNIAHTYVGFAPNTPTASHCQWSWNAGIDTACTDTAFTVEYNHVTGVFTVDGLSTPAPGLSCVGGIITGVVSKTTFCCWPQDEFSVINLTFG